MPEIFNKVQPNPTAQDASSSDSDLLRTSPVWPPLPRNSASGASGATGAKPKPLVEPPANLSDSSRTLSSQEEETTAAVAKGIFTLSTNFVIDTDVK